MNSQEVDTARFPARSLMPVVTSTWYVRRAWSVTLGFRITRRDAASDRTVAATYRPVLVSRNLMVDVVTVLARSDSRKAATMLAVRETPVAPDEGDRPETLGLVASRLVVNVQLVDGSRFPA